MSDLQPTELDADVLALGSALIVATVGPDGEPRACRASSWELIDAAQRRVRVAVAADDPQAVSYLVEGPEPRYLAVTGADVATLRSIQLKGRVVATEPPDDTDLALVARHNDVFISKIEATDGHPPNVIRRFLPSVLIMVELIVEEAYDQTPGPAAGAALLPGGA